MLIRIPAATAEPITPATLGPIACISRKLEGFSLRLSEKLYADIAAWAEDDFRSVNGQIEYLLSECVRQRKKDGKYVSEEIDVPPELDIK